MKFLLLGLLLSFSISQLNGQDRIERETRISKSEVPDLALTFIEKIGLPNKYHWYKEIGLKTVSYECKSKIKRQRFSIEFSSEGVLEDVEIEINKKGIPKKILKSIDEYLKTDIKKFKIRKIQLQYSGNPEKIQAQFFNLKADSDISLRYELIVSTQLSGTFTQFEYHFDDEGKFIHRFKVIQTMTDNLEY